MLLNYKDSKLHLPDPKLKLFFPQLELIWNEQTCSLVDWESVFKQLPYKTKPIPKTTLHSTLIRVCSMTQLDLNRTHMHNMITSSSLEKSCLLKSANESNASNSNTEFSLHTHLIILNKTYIHDWTSFEFKLHEQYGHQLTRRIFLSGYLIESQMHYKPFLWQFITPHQSNHFQLNLHSCMILIYIEHTWSTWGCSG
jgi:hypothetical protein